MYNIVIADDSRVIREKIKLILKGSDFNVLGEASNGMDALDICLDLKPDIITLDINMPKLDGLEVISKLRASGFQGKIIVLTGLSDKKIIKQAIVLGANTFLIKPFEKEKLLLELTKLMD